MPCASDARRWASRYSLLRTWQDFQLASSARWKEELPRLHWPLLHHRQSYWKLKLANCCRNQLQSIRPYTKLNIINETLPPALQAQCANYVDNSVWHFILLETLGLFYLWLPEETQPLVETTHAPVGVGWNIKDAVSIRPIICWTRMLNHQAGVVSSLKSPTVFLLYRELEVLDKVRLRTVPFLIAPTIN